MIDIQDLTVAIHGTPILRGRLARHRARRGLRPRRRKRLGQIHDGARADGPLARRGDRKRHDPARSNRPSAQTEAAWCATRGNDIAMIFQEPMTALNPVQTIGDQVAETLTIHGQADRNHALKIARDRLDRVGLPQIGLDAYPHELSGGQRQRVCIAAAIALHPVS
jgi:peptide/nickel transport system ATP-binding protein